MPPWICWPCTTTRPSPSSSLLPAKPHYGELIVRFEVHPEARRCPEHSFEIQSSFRRNPLPAADNLVDRLRRPARLTRKFPLADTPRLDFLFQEFARRNHHVRGKLGNLSLSRHSD